MELMLFTLTYTYFYTSIKVNCQLPVFISIYLFIPEARPEGEADQIVKYSKTLRRKKLQTKIEIWNIFRIKNSVWQYLPSVIRSMYENFIDSSTKIQILNIFTALQDLHPALKMLGLNPLEQEILDLTNEVTD